MPSNQDLVETAVSAGAFNTLIAAAEAAGLVETLPTEGPFTVLAPMDDAFAKIPARTLETFPKRENRERLASILEYHIIPGRVFATDALDQGRATTLQCDTVAFALRGGRLTVNGANVVNNDIDASNGVIHVIDTVLMPPAAAAAPSGRLVVGIYTGSVDNALAAQIGVDGDETLLVTGFPKRSGAEAAGLKQYDVITLINDRPATSANLSRAKKDAGYGNTIALVVVRRGETLRIDVPVDVDPH
jgi:uncharacterized surface protein with fasciclin (FAS1) repeats